MNFPTHIFCFDKTSDRRGITSLTSPPIYVLLVLNWIYLDFFIVLEHLARVQHHYGHTCFMSLILCYPRTYLIWVVPHLRVHTGEWKLKPYVFFLDNTWAYVENVKCWPTLENYISAYKSQLDFRFLQTEFQLNYLNLFGWQLDKIMLVSIVKK